MSNYDQPATWGDISSAVGKPVLVQVASRQLQPREELLGVFDFELDQLLPLYWWGDTSNVNLVRSAYRILRQLFHGRPWSGKSGTAAKFWSAVRKSSSREDHSDFVMVLTDRRMLVLNLEQRSTNPRPYKPKVLLELPSGTYVLRPEAPKSRLTHRFDLAFADGTWIALMAGWTDRKNNAEYEETLRQITNLLAG